MYVDKIIVNKITEIEKKNTKIIKIQKKNILKPSICIYHFVFYFYIWFLLCGSYLEIKNNNENEH